MKSIFLSLLALFSALAFAQPDSEIVKAKLESQPSCANAVRFDDENIYLGFGEYRKLWEEPRQPIPATLTVAPLAEGAESFTLATTDAALDSIRDGNTLFILTYSGIEEWDLPSRKMINKIPTYAIGHTMAYMEHPRAFARFGDKAILAHGRLGVSFFDLKTKRIVNQFRLVQNQLPLESMAMGVTVQGNLAYVVMDNFSLVTNGKPAFRGFVVINLDTQSVVSELDGMDPGVDSVTSIGNTLVASFMGYPIWKYDLVSLGGKSLPEPQQRISQFPGNGHPTGHAAMDDKYYYTCFVKAPAKPGGAYKLVPLALERSALKLD